MKKYRKVCGVTFMHNDTNENWWIVASLLLCLAATCVVIYGHNTHVYLTEELDKAEAQTVVAPVPVVIQPEVEPVKSFEQGLASYYSREGCLGCSESLEMANGEPLDDTKQTVAYNKAPLGSYVAVTNIKNNRRVVAKVTDRGGYEKAGKVIDLSIATRDALGCANTCLVKVERIEQ